MGSYLLAVCTPRWTSPRPAIRNGIGSRTTAPWSDSCRIVSARATALSATEMPNGIVRLLRSDFEAAKADDIHFGCCLRLGAFFELLSEVRLRDDAVFSSMAA